MTRHIRWGLLFFNLILIALAGTASYWLPLLEPLQDNEAEEAAANAFACPVGFEDDICAELARVDAENDIEAQQMIVALLEPPLPAPSQESSPDSLWGDLDRSTYSLTEETLILTGQFIQLDPLHWAQGTVNLWELVADDEIYRYLRFENEFEASRGPNLHIYLSISPEPRSAEEVLAGDTAIDLGELKGNLGGQNYLISNDIDILDYQSVVIFSRRYGRIFSSAPLNLPIR